MNAETSVSTPCKIAVMSLFPREKVPTCPVCQVPGIGLPAAHRSLLCSATQRYTHLPKAVSPPTPPLRQDDILALDHAHAMSLPTAQDCLNRLSSDVLVGGPISHALRPHKRTRKVSWFVVGVRLAPTAWPDAPPFLSYPSVGAPL